MSDNGSLRDLFMLRPDVIYLNHGSAGACARPVFQAYQDWQCEYQRYPVGFSRIHGDAIDQARATLGQFLGADPGSLVYVVNATMGLNIVARSIPLAPGDEVLSTDHEYGSIERTWQFCCAKHDAHYVRQPIPVPVESADQVVDALWAGVTDRTRVLLFSHIPSPTAWILPAKEIVRRAREAGIITVIDGAHAPGQIDLQLDDLGADFYVGDCHKWMTAPTGSAFLYASPEAQSMLEPLVISWGWGTDAPRISRFVDEHQIQGTRDLSAFLAVPAAIQFMQEHDWASVRQRCNGLLSFARRELAGFTGLPPLTPDGPGWFSQMASLPLPSCDSAALWTYLHDEHHIEIPVVQWNGHTMVRLSVQAYNTAEEIEALIQAVQAFYS